MVIVEFVCNFLIDLVFIKLFDIFLFNFEWCYDFFGMLYDKFLIELVLVVFRFGF